MTAQSDLIPPDIQVIQAPRGRAVQMNQGAAASKGEILVFCHADSQLPSGWREAVIDALKILASVVGHFKQKYSRPKVFSDGATHG